MSHLDFYKEEKFKIPTVIAVFIIALIIFVFFNIFSDTSMPSRASKKKALRVEITNISPTQSTIYWQTEKQEKGWIVYGESETNINTAVFDDRDLKTEKNEYINHYITLKGLNENQQYFFKIISNNNNIILNNNDKAFYFKTPKSVERNNTLSLAYGKVIQSNGEALENAIVLLSVDKELVLSARTKSKGDWLMTISENLYTYNGLKIPPITKDNQINIEIINEKNEKSSVKTNLFNLNPLPETVVIGKNYSFTNIEGNVLASFVKKDNTTDTKIAIIYPKEGAIIDTKSPLIKGTALPNKEVIVIIESGKVFSTRVKSNEEGKWAVTDLGEISAGLYTMEVQTIDKNGQKVIMKRKFTLAKSGERAVLGEATAEPTLISEPTIALTELPTYAPTATVVASPSAQPVPGIISNKSLIIGVSLFVAGLGLLLAF